MTRRALLGLGVAAGGLIVGLRAWQAASRSITLRYDAPDGELTVIIYASDGQRVRRTTFGPGIERQHALRLPDGAYRAELRVAGRTSARPFRVERDAALLIDWR